MISKDKAEKALIEHARGLLGLARADPALLDDVLARPLELGADRDTLAAELAATLVPTDSPAHRRSLRRFRHRGVVRIALREVLRLADVEETSAEMAHLASVVIDAALEGARAREAELRGRSAVPLTVLGMGKLGGLELNLGSDVDLVFFYETDDDAVEGDPSLSVHELYSRVVRRAASALSEVTEDGFCFRVDLRLRPEGSRGPLVNSLASAERYYESWGRPWERAALLRARPVAGDLAFGEALLEALRPFVFRRDPDPTIAYSMQEMLRRSRRELSADETRDVKLGRGGIREAEFFVQTLQLVWGGRDPALRVPGTLEGLRRLAAAGLVTDREAETLAHAWALLRRVEHRIHVWCGYQTHTLPAEPEALERIAWSLGHASADELRRALERAQRDVAALFDSVLPEHEPDPGAAEGLLDAVASGADPDVLAEPLAALLDVNDAHESATHLSRMARRADGPFGPVSRETAPELGRALFAEVGGAADPDAALRSLADFFARLGNAAAYGRLLLERPRVMRRLIGLFGASGTLSAALVGHPEDLDLLLSSETPTREAIEAAHAPHAGPFDAPPDEELVVRELRRLKRTFTLEVGLAYVAREADRALATDRLSTLAEAQIRAALAAARAWACARWGAPAGASLVVVAMGKLGGRELGFGGDLDLVFLYDRDGETDRGVTHAELFTRIAQRTMLLLRQRDAEGPGYETDTRLRPSGSRGTLVVSFSAFDHYHAGEAAAWERQALIRARPVAGDPMAGEEVARRFTRLAYLEGPTPPDELARIRGRMQRELAGETATRYHPKLGYGGLTDVELLVQWLQMRHGHDLGVRTPSTAEAIEALAAHGHLRAHEADALRSSHALLRDVELALKLYDEHREPTLEPDGRSGSHVARMLSIHARDGMRRAEALTQSYRTRAQSARALFEEHVAPVDAPAPWEERAP
ncbi:MAG: bifunctional [glutamate--ammonia ligase]-adenylyl-L-tyrosine phosphorylase/[glutamate--ammonia-ligase] adenylyltransferase [Sandaracinaceae bacterium]|nr:bifunctional [glutamate--ammonia ligase]-adenylyl-L-tyrosine phosphorylase/[glutamate--ammonia-ligase] adenylyltransferase [Sandaracinaceae bacterium]